MSTAGTDGVIAAIRKDIQLIQPLDSLESAQISDTLLWLDSGVPIFRITPPADPPRHLVAYFVVVDPDHQSLLLGDHIKAQLWLPTGGHVEQGEHPRATVVREMQEELGQQAIFLRGNNRPFFLTTRETVGLTAGHTDVSMWYLLRGGMHQRLQFDRCEFTDMAWFSFDEILASHPAIFDTHMQRFTRKLQSYLGR